MDYLNRVWRILESYSHLGERTLANGTRLIAPAPHVAPEAWLHQIFAPIDDQGIARLESDLGGPLPDEFTQFLMRNNGLGIFSYSISIFGLRTSFARTGDAVWQPFSLLTPNIRERPRDAKASFCFMGAYRDDASLLYIDTTDHQVYRCERHSAKPLNRWDDFSTMLESETERISQLFDLEGRPFDPHALKTPA